MTIGSVVRDKMKTYAWVGGDDPAQETEQMKTLMAQGWDTFKLNGCGRLRMIDSHRAVDKVIERIAVIRENLGSSVDFGLDFHGRVSVPMAKVLLRELEPFGGQDRRVSPVFRHGERPGKVLFPL